MKNRTMINRIISLSIITFLLILIPINIYAKSTELKFSDIDLIVKIPSELGYFTQSTTSNNQYVEKIGANSANEVRSSMEATHTYLEAFPDDISYEIAIVGFKANSTLTNFVDLDKEDLNKTFDNYIASQLNASTDKLKETLNSKEIVEIDGLYFFKTNVTSKSLDSTVHSQKYYTVHKGYVYTYALQSNKELDEDMINTIEEIISSAKYTPVKKSIFENGIVAETLTIIGRAIIPIGILGLILYFFTVVYKKKTTKLVNEELELKAKRAAEKNKKKE